MDDWRKVDSDNVIKVEGQISRLFSEYFPVTQLGFSIEEARKIIEDTPPIPQIKARFSLNPVDMQISAYQYLYLRFDGLACLAETLIEMYAKQGELIIYDQILESHLEACRDKRGSVEEFIVDSVESRPCRIVSKSSFEIGSSKK